MLISLTAIDSIASQDCSTYRFNTSASNKEYRSGDLVIIDVRITNISHDYLSIPSIIEPQDYWLKLNLTHNGSGLKYIGPEMKIKDRQILTTIRQGYYYGREIILNNYFDISKPGKYSLQVTYGVGPDLTEIPQGKCIQSLTFSILEK